MKVIIKNFDCSHNSLHSLEGCPTEISENFSCGHNRLTSFKGGPTKVGENYFASSNSIESLEGLAAHIGNTLWIGSQYNIEEFRKIRFTKEEIHAVCGVGKISMY